MHHSIQLLWVDLLSMGVSFAGTNELSIVFHIIEQSFLCDLNALGCFVNLFFPKVPFISTSDVMFKATCSSNVNTVIYHCTAFNSSDTSVGCYKISLILTVHSTCCTAFLTSL